MKRNEKILLIFNAVVILTIFALNFVYQSHGFDFTLKTVCSGAFALLGAANLTYSLVTKRGSVSFFACMAAGLVLAFLGDVLIGYDFIVGAATFALGHVCFVVAYCFVQRMKPLDLIISGVLFTGAAIFLLFCPLLSFEVPLFKAVCVVYALIISLMLGKATGNLVREKNAFTATVAFASALFFFSDLMLVLDWFIGRWDWTDHACMGTYYPALCFLAFSMILKALYGKRDNR